MALPNHDTNGSIEEMLQFNTLSLSIGQNISSNMKIFKPIWFHDSKYLYLTNNQTM